MDFIAIIILLAVIAFITCIILHFLLYKISFSFLLKEKLEYCFEEINANKMILMSFLIVYLLPLAIGSVGNLIFKAIGIHSYSLVLSLLANIICFIGLFYYFWENLIIKNQEDTKLKVMIVSYLALLPYIIMIIVQVTIGLFIFRT